jgi:hypothetical protein
MSWSNTPPTPISPGGAFDNTAPGTIAAGSAFTGDAPGTISAGSAFSNTPPAGRDLSDGSSQAVAIRLDDGSFLSAPLAGDKIFYVNAEGGLELVDPLALRTDGSVDFGAIS